MYIVEDIWIHIKSFIFVPHYLALKNFRKNVIPSIPKYISLLFIPRRVVCYCNKQKKYIFLRKNIEYLRYMKCNYILTTSNKNKI